MTNLEQMRSAHRTTYQKFFARYDLVTSVNFCINWAPSGFLGNKCMRTMTKTPFECLIGIRPSKDLKISFANVCVYNTGKDIFEEVSLSKITDQESALTELVKDFLWESKYTGVEIWIFSETSRGHGFGFSGSMAAALATALFVLTKRCSAKEIEDRNFPNSELYDAIFNLALRISKILRYNNTLGANITTGLLPGNIFLAQFNTPTAHSGTVDDSEDAVATLEVQSFCEIFSDVKEGSIISSDYGIVYSGLRTDTKSIELHKKTDESYLNTFSEFLSTEFPDAVESIGLFKKLSCAGEFYGVFADAISALSVQIVYFLRKLLKNGYEDNTLDHLIKVMNLCRHALAMMIPPEQFPDKFRSTFLSVSSYPNADIGLFPIYGGKMGGGYLFMMKPQVTRETMDEALTALRGQYPNAKIEYANYLHGETSSSVQIRQDLHAGCVAQELKGGGGFLYSNNSGVFEIAGLNEILEKNENDILFNAASGEIYIQGKPVDSTQLKSQNATIDLFLTLLSNGSVSNRDLPTSSYSKNRSEMQSKILGPISKITEELLGRRIPIVCSGSITDFIIELESTDIRIGAIKKLGK